MSSTTTTTGSQAPSAAPSPSRTTRSRWLALGVLCAGFLMVILDQNIVNVALPSIQSDLGFSQAGLAWVVNAYMIAFGGLLLLAGRLGDLVGRRRVLLAGLAVFTAASLWCGLATSRGMLVVARFVQGVGGAVASAVILGMVVTLFPEPRLRARAIGVYSFVGAGGASVGLLAGGLLTQAASWHWIFFVNVPVGAAVVALAVRVLDPDPAAARGRVDTPGGLLVTAALMLGVYAILGAVDHGWASARTLGLGAVAVVLLAAFVARQARAAHPLLPLRVLRSRDRAGANLVIAVMIAGMLGQFFLGALYLQRVLGFGPLGVGLAYLPVAVAIGTLSVAVSPRLTARLGGRAVALVSLPAAVVGLLLLARTPVDGHYASDVLPAFLLLGAAGGLGFPALTTLAMSGASPADSGVVSGLVNTTQQVGGALGLAVLATLSASRTDHLLAKGNGTAEALTGGYHLGFAVAAAVVAAGIVASLTVLRTRDGATAGAGAADGEAPATAP